ncbi:hypothetical protein [Nonomuraea typhae]|uniref:Uncharacterized protein n=1 Tax=Nonomuraea typhae TaxID=2603600 RepID=A0ABW7Z2K9_9ACTN
MTKFVWGCGECGSADIEVTRAPRPAEAWQWLRYGGHWRQEQGRCRACGSPGVRAVEFGPMPEWRSRLLIPVRLVQVLHRRRRVTPTPVNYLVPAAAAIVTAAIAQIFWGPVWWLLPPAVVILLWLAYLTTALRSPWPRSPLGQELLDVLAPRGRLRRHRTEEEKRYRSAPFPLYGLPYTWDGRRYACCSSWSGPRRPVTMELGLCHGNPEVIDGPRLTVAVSNRPDSGGLRLRREVAEMRLAALPPLGHVRAILALPDPEWREISIRIDGQPQVFRHAAEGHCWLAVAVRQDHTITVQGRRFPLEQVELVRVEDPSRYFERWGELG